MRAVEVVENDAYIHVTEVDSNELFWPGYV
jgi:hypothetical protein